MVSDCPTLPAATSTSKRTLIMLPHLAESCHVVSFHTDRTHSHFYVSFSAFFLDFYDREEDEQSIVTLSTCKLPDLTGDSGTRLNPSDFQFMLSGWMDLVDIQWSVLILLKN